MNSLASFDEAKIYLGDICKYNHEWNNTGKSLRYISRKSCVECTRFKSRKYYQTNREEILLRDNDYAKRNREKIRIYDRQHYQKNKQKHSESNRQSYIRHREARLEYRKQYYLNNKQARYLLLQRRRANIKLVHQFKYTPEQVKELFQQFENKCAYCDDIATSIDHVIPLSCGGPNVLGNLLPSCERCNKSKWNRDVYEWYHGRPFFTIKRWRKILKVLGKNENNLNQLPLF